MFPETKFHSLAIPALQAVHLALRKIVRHRAVKVICTLASTYIGSRNRLQRCDGWRSQKSCPKKEFPYQWLQTRLGQELAACHDRELSRTWTRDWIENTFHEENHLRWGQPTLHWSRRTIPAREMTTLYSLLIDNYVSLPCQEGANLAQSSRRCQKKHNLIAAHPTRTREPLPFSYILVSLAYDAHIVAL